jgi:hypothetical protein
MGLFLTLRVPISIDFVFSCIIRVAIFPSLAGMSLTTLSLAGNKLDIPAGDGKIANLFYSVGLRVL